MKAPQRVVRVPLPVSLIRRMDELLVSGKGGYGTRAEFIEHAVEAMALETEHGVALEQPGQQLESAQDDVTHRPSAQTIQGTNASELSVKEVSPLSISETVIRELQDGLVTIEGSATVVDAPLFGLHNRDYPSIWAARRIAIATRESPQDFMRLQQQIGNEAWQFAERLQDIQEGSILKVTALFPTNREKAEAATSAFISFALGHAEVTSAGIEATGPLFAWNVCQLQSGESGLLIGMTRAGRALLMALDGISLQFPHKKEHTVRFISHIRRYAPNDWLAFRAVLEYADSGPGRKKLVELMNGRWPEWSRSVASTNTSGYVARTREWGLLEPKLRDGRYVLTPLGKEILRREGGD